jgi:hypothetical protein
MFSEADSEFIRAMCQYLPKWSGVTDESAVIFRLHGQKDQSSRALKLAAKSSQMPVTYLQLLTQGNAANT